MGSISANLTLECLMWGGIKRDLFSVPFSPMFCYWKVEIIDLHSQTSFCGNQTFSFQADLVFFSFFWEEGVEEEKRSCLD